MIFLTLSCCHEQKGIIYIISNFLTKLLKRYRSYFLLYVTSHAPLQFKTVSVLKRKENKNKNKKANKKVKDRGIFMLHGIKTLN